MNTNANTFNFDVFVPVFIAIYKKYIESGRAPLELNLSDEDRTALQNIYQKIIIKKSIKDDSSKILNEDEFWHLWYYLCKATRNTFALLYASSRQGQQRFGLK